MDETNYKIIAKLNKIEMNKKISKEIKVLSAVCLFFSFCYCNGTKKLESVDKGQIVLTNLVWIISFVVLIGLYIKDSNCIKNNKALEFDIYRLEVEDLNDKKEIAEITGEILSDNLLNKQIDMPDEKIYLPTLYYCILAVIDIIIRIVAFIGTNWQIKRSIKRVFYGKSDFLIGFFEDFELAKE